MATTFKPHPAESQKYPENRTGTRAHRAYTRFGIGASQRPSDGEAAQPVGRLARLWENASPRMLARARRIAQDNNAPMPSKRTPKLRALVGSMLYLA